VSKYEQRGAYHYDEFRRPQSIYRAHVLDLIEKVELHVPPKGDIIEIGAGEGLILDQLAQRGFVCDGCDIDTTAVILAKQKRNPVEHGSIELFEGRKVDAVLLCDVLEHVESPIAVMAKARELAPVVVIAVPDRHDRHAIHVVDPDAVRSYMEPSGYHCVHQSQRHARHLLIFKRQA
jgi:2-polyprenyl-3-methyl-5-hydroxy-6-metoxy-1,4-benzoquinol methylase